MEVPTAFSTSLDLFDLSLVYMKIVVLRSMTVRTALS